MTTYTVRVVREAGVGLISGEESPYEEEILNIVAGNEQQTLTRSYVLSKIKFDGQVRKTYINGKEYNNNKF